MNDTNRFDGDLALFAMQLLTEDESAAVRSEAGRSPELQRELSAVQGDLAVLAWTADMHSPPALARERLLKQIAREKKVLPMQQTPAMASRSGYGAGPGTLLQDGERRPEPTRGAAGDAARPSGLGRVLPWVGWAVAAGLALTAGNFYHESQALRGDLASQQGEVARLAADATAARQVMDTLRDPQAVRVTLTRSKQAPQPQGKATYLADRGSLIFVASNLEPLGSFKTYELWLIPANGHDPIPAGTFHPDGKGNASLITPDLPKGVVAKAFGITVEDEGGSQTPTMPILLAGAAGA